ncbi:MAG TPA: hypothetical protein VJJ82_03705 [Candidatus Nanoarchaeia archaeon]|nr:hypothetical protein [Candidatus Nanoarchaeia archaeon]
MGRVHFEINSLSNSVQNAVWYFASGIFVFGIGAAMFLFGIFGVFLSVAMAAF